MARDLIRRGENVHLIELNQKGLRLAPAGSWDVRGQDDPDSWYYRLDLFGPSGNRTVLVPARQVVHVRYSVDPARPWLGLSPLAWARETGRLHAEVEKLLANEVAGVSGYLLPVPTNPGSPEEDDSELAELRGDIRQLAGRTTLVIETTSAGWGQGPSERPLSDWKSQRLGANPPEVLALLRSDSALSVIASCGIPVELVVGGAGNAASLAYRRWTRGALAAMAETVAGELREKLELPSLSLSFDKLDPVDIGQVTARTLQSRAGAVKTLVDAGIDAWGKPCK